jgi:hypothetical protein
MTNGDNRWQSIASAPQDETILVYSLRWGAIVASYASERGEWVPRMQFPSSLGDGDAALITHWMPMPGVPAGLTRTRSPWLSLAA